MNAYIIQGHTGMELKPLAYNRAIATLSLLIIVIKVKAVLNVAIAWSLLAFTLKSHRYTQLARSV